MAPTTHKKQSYVLKGLGLLTALALLTIPLTSQAGSVNCKNYSKDAIDIERKYKQALSAGDFQRLKQLRSEKKRIEKWQDDCKRGSEEKAENAGKKTSKKDTKKAGKKAKKDRTAKEILKDIEEKYGVDLGKNGAKATKDSYKSAPNNIKNKVKDRNWTKGELELIEESLGLLDDVLDGDKDNLKNISKVNSSISQKGDGGYTVGKSDTTMGEWFNKSQTLILTDKAGDLTAFKDKDTEFKGTLIHEVAHGLFGNYDPRTGKKYDDSLDNPLFKEWLKATGWEDDGDTFPTGAGAPSEKPPTGYANTNAGEDLSESVMLYLLDKKKFKKSNPKRAKFLDEVFRLSRCHKTGLPCASP